MKCYECGQMFYTIKLPFKNIRVFRTKNGRKIEKNVFICVACQAIAELSKHQGDVKYSIK